MSAGVGPAKGTENKQWWVLCEISRPVRITSSRPLTFRIIASSRNHHWRKEQRTQMCSPEETAEPLSVSSPSISLGKQKSSEDPDGTIQPVDVFRSAASNDRQQLMLLTYPVWSQSFQLHLPHSIYTGRRPKLATLVTEILFESSSGALLFKYFPF